MFYYNLANKTYVLQPKFSHDVTYERNIHALYTLAKGEYSNLGYQFGLRGEYTYRDIILEGTGETFNIDRWDYFPSLHISYTLADKNQFLASYSRRIDRPRGWSLEPFLTWSDAYNVRSGNPGLKPEYIDSYELGYQRDLGDNSFSAELYYRRTVNQIERIRSLYKENIMLSTFENVGTDYAIGTELMLNTQLFKWWESDVTGNFFDYRVTGKYNSKSFDRHSFTWSMRWNNIFNITKSTRLQLNPSYN